MAGPQVGDRAGVWYLESRAKPVDGKRFWNVTNTEDDTRMVVAQTDLKALANNTYDPEAAMPSSSQITARVIAGNYRHDPFNIPAGVFPEDESEFPFEVSFVEPSVEEFAAAVQAPAGTWVEDERHRGFRFVPSETEPDDNEPDDEAVAMEMYESAVEHDPQFAAQIQNQDDSELRKLICDAMVMAADLKDQLDRCLKASLNR